MVNKKIITGRILTTEKYQVQAKHKSSKKLIFIDPERLEKEIVTKCKISENSNKEAERVSNVAKRHILIRFIYIASLVLLNILIYRGLLAICESYKDWQEFIKLLKFILTFNILLFPSAYVLITMVSKTNIINFLLSVLPTSVIEVIVIYGLCA